MHGDPPAVVRIDGDTHGIRHDPKVPSPFGARIAATRSFG
jgi:hypothetical protein